MIPAATQTDPAVDAAERTSRKIEAGLIEQGVPWPVLTTAAREALTPIRAELTALATATVPPCDPQARMTAYEAAIHRISELSFSTEELSDE